MRGTRYGDFSRLDVEVAKGYRSVLLQQGRVQLDADQNIQAELALHELRSSLRDLLGEGWAPARSAGFEIEPLTALAFDGECGLLLAREEAAALLSPPVLEQLTIELSLTWQGGAATVLEAACEDGVPAAYRLDIGERGHLALHLAGDRVLRTETPMSAGVASRISVVLGGDSVAILLDARQLDRARWDPRRLGPVSLLTLGAPAAPDEFGGGFRGLFTSVHMWGRELSPAQLAGVAGGPQGQVRGDDSALAWWRLDRHGAAALTDVVGGLTALAYGSSAPVSRLVDLRIGRGLYYVGGVRCEQRRQSTYRHQSATARAPLPTKGRHLVYLESWEETVSAVQDPELLEVALGGLDTSVRTRIASCVRIAEHRHGQGHEQSVRGLLAARHEGALIPGNHLYRVEVHTSGRLEAESQQEIEIEIVEIDFEGWELLLAEVWTGPRTGPFEIEIIARDGAVAPSRFRHCVAGVSVGEDETTSLRLASDPAQLVGRQGLRVSTRGPAPTFKWSRNNGADLFAIVRAQAGAHTAEVLPARWLAPLAVGDVVEPLDEHSSLEDPAQPLLRVEHATDHAGRVILEGELPAGTTLLRRWHHDPVAAADGAIPGERRWTELEDGISFHPEPGSFRRGDYWWILARQDLGSIEWPQEGGHPSALPPTGVERGVAPLALLHLDAANVEIEDLRTIGGCDPGDPGGSDAARAPAGEHEGRLTGTLVEARAGAASMRDRALALVPERPSDAGDVGQALAAIASAPIWRPAWRLLRTIEQAAEGLEDAIGTAEGVVLATSAELLRLVLENGSCERLAELPERRTGFALRAAANGLLLLGGRAGGKRADGRVIEFDPGGGAWRERHRLPGAREGAALVVLGGDVHALGGRAGGLLHGQRASHHVYERESDRWRSVRPKLRFRCAHATAVALDGRLHLLGGVERDGTTPRGLNEVLHGDRRLWRADPGVPGPRRVLGACAHHGHLVVLVADVDADTQATLTFEPATATWTAHAPLPDGLHEPRLVEYLGGALLLGKSGSALAVHQLELPGGDG
jgi:Family of unknown function (DUF6519)